MQDEMSAAEKQYEDAKARIADLERQLEVPDFIIMFRVYVKTYLSIAIEFNPCAS